mgnify:CR=1 FL=1
MKRKFLSILLTLAMALTLLPTAAMAEGAEAPAGGEPTPVEAPAETKVAQIGETKYETLAEAVAAVPTNNAETEIVLLNDYIGSGIKVVAGKNIVFNLNGKTYTVNKPTVGSSGTETNGFQLLKGSKVTFKNGALSSKTGADSLPNGGILIQNYCDLTLENVTLDTSANSNISYVISNNFGSLTAKGDTVIKAADGKVAFDLWYGMDNDGLYDDGVSVTFGTDFTGSVTGKIEYGAHSRVTSNDWKDKAKLTIANGNFDTTFVDSNTNDGVAPENFNISISGGYFISDPTAYLAKDCKIEMVGNAYGVVPDSDAVAQNGEKTFVSLQNAINDAKDGETITLLKDVDLGNTVTVANKTVTLNMAGKTIYNTKDLWDSKPYAWSLISVRENGNLTITGDGTLKAKADDCYALDTQEESAKLTVENGTVIGNISAIYAFQGEVTINGGSYSIQQLNTNNVQDGYGLTINCYDQNYKNQTAKIIVTGGYFAHFDPSNNKAEGAGTNFVADGYVSVTSDKSGYDYKVVQKTDTGSIVVKPAVAKPEVNVSDKISENDKTAVENAAKSVAVPTLGAAANAQSQQINAEKAAALIANATEVDRDNAKLYVQVSLKVTPTAYTDTTGNKELALEITPQYRIVASTADKADDIKLSGSSKNAQVVQDYQNLTITAPTVVTMELPTGFANDGDKLSIKHTKGNGTVEYYTGIVTETSSTKTLTFTTNGFSPFVISSAVASIDGVMYPTLTEAVANVDSGKTITLETDCAEAVTVSRTVAFTLDANGHTHTGKIVSGSYTVEANAAVTSVAGYTGAFAFAYTAPSHSSSGGSSSSSRRYDVSAPSVKHGDVTVSPKNASKGDTVTITVKPDSGYELDTLTVKDASGSKIKVKDKGDGKFTFTMPASKVTVSAEFAEIETLDFADVSTDAYYYEAVKWAAKKGITGGTGDGTFNPNGSCTRAHIVTFLWRAAGSPEPKSTVSFADVPAGSYYAKAVAWAVENGITLGTGDGTFSPNATCTRAQSVTFLYRALGTAPTTVNGFTDVTADAFYADAVAWAVESGVTNGTTDSTFSPNNGCTRAQIVTFLYRTMK